MVVNPKTGTATGCDPCVLLLVIQGASQWHDTSSQLGVAATRSPFQASSRLCLFQGLLVKQQITKHHPEARKPNMTKPGQEKTQAKPAIEDPWKTQKEKEKLRNH